ncbi:MAG: hypothetical protein BMS9Abin26_1119 [Gammaproteobacteria bacterium]|nr:MAG: hypothetical protein BMS9Abin26_1119 [Gammaproteobacteria bacterium]
MKKLYHYTGCGLRNIYLRDGYKIRETAYGKTVSIEDLDGLHQAIACDLVHYKKKLSGTEFRFIRKELDMSQNRLAELVGTKEQTLSLWERKSNVPVWADRLVRKIYLEFMGGNETIIELVDRLNNLDRKEYEKKRTYIETDEGWHVEADAA